MGHVVVLPFTSMAREVPVAFKASEEPPIVTPVPMPPTTSAADGLAICAVEIEAALNPPLKPCGAVHIFVLPKLSLIGLLFVPLPVIVMLSVVILVIGVVHVIVPPVV